MKKKLIFFAAFILIAWAFNSCDKLACKMCATNTYENGSLIDPGTETEYCGSDLLAQEAIPDITVGNMVTKVECN